MEIKGKRMKKSVTKEHTVSYDYKVCECENLKKIAPMWFFCRDCGKVFYFMLSNQFTFEEAVKHWSGFIGSLDKVKQAVQKSERKEMRREKAADKEAVKNYTEKVKNDSLQKSKHNKKANC